MEFENQKKQIRNLLTTQVIKVATGLPLPPSYRAKIVSQMPLKAHLFKGAPNPPQTTASAGSQEVASFFSSHPWFLQPVNENPSNHKHRKVNPCGRLSPSAVLGSEEKLQDLCSRTVTSPYSTLHSPLCGPLAVSVTLKV